MDLKFKHKASLARHGKHNKRGVPVDIMGRVTISMQACSRTVVDPWKMKKRFCRGTIPLNHRRRHLVARAIVPGKCDKSGRRKARADSSINLPERIGL